MSGVGLEIIDSSIWVATMTGFALSRALSMIFFWRNGTSSAGISTPRSPRATMKPSNAAITSSRFSIAWGFSILAMTGRKMFSSRMILRTSSTSAALRTKLSAMKSTVRCSAKRRSSMSFSDSAGTETATPGRLMPLWLLTFPPTSTSQTTSVPSLTSVARSRTLPSSMRIGSPTCTSPARPLYVVPQISALPSTSRVVMVQTWPRFSVTGPPENPSSRIFGPWRSARIPTPWPLASAASRTSRYASA